MKLTDDLQTSFEYGGHFLLLNLSFDNVLLLFDLFKDEEVSDEHKIVWAIEMLVINHELFNGSPLQERQAVLYAILKRFLDIDMTDDPKPEKRVMDYAEDAERIYSSFVAEYRMDLHDLKGKLDWRKFIALLNNLSDESAFKKVVGYRAMKTPSATNNKEYHDHIVKMKQLYELEQPEGVMNRGLDQAADFLRGKVVKKNG